jgi:hypothetical protein
LLSSFNDDKESTIIESAAALGGSIISVIDSDVVLVELFTVSLPITENDRMKKIMATMVESLLVISGYDVC